MFRVVQMPILLLLLPNSWLSFLIVGRFQEKPTLAASWFGKSLGY